MSIARDKALHLVCQCKSRDPRYIAQHLGLSIVEMSLPNRFRGFLYHGEDNPTIVVNKDLTEREKRTVIAHEIGHYCLDPEYELCMHLADKIRSTKSEKRADLFAATLLIESWKGEPWQIAERSNVEEELVVSVMEQLDQKGYMPIINSSESELTRHSR